MAENIREQVRERARQLVTEAGMSQERAVERARREVQERTPDRPRDRDDVRATLERAQRLATMGPPVRASLAPTSDPSRLADMAQLGGGEDAERRGGIEEMAMIGMDTGGSAEGDDGDDGEQFGLSFDDGDGDGFGLDFGGEE